MLNSVNPLFNNRQVPSPPVLPESSYQISALPISIRRTKPDPRRSRMRVTSFVFGYAPNAVHSHHSKGVPNLIEIDTNCRNSFWPMLCLRRGCCTCRTNAAIDDPNATKKMTLRWRKKFVVPAFGQKGGRSKGKKEKRKKGKKGKN